MNTFDQEATRALLTLSADAARRRLAALVQQARVAVGETCPHCGHTSTDHESNADGSTMLCVGCGELWDT